MCSIKNNREAEKLGRVNLLMKKKTKCHHETSQNDVVLEKNINAYCFTNSEYKSLADTATQISWIQSLLQ